MIRELLITGAILLTFAYASRAKPVTAEQRLVAAVLVAEAGGEKDPRAMAAVLEVIRNRAKRNDQRIGVVVTSHLQFSCLNGVADLDAFVAEKAGHPKFAEALRLVCSRKRTDYTHGARFYHRDNILPEWARGAKPSAWIGRQRFYSELQ